MPWYAKIFLALGGAGLIWKVVGDNARNAVHQGLGWALHKFPLFASFVRANEEHILAILRDSEAGAEDAIKEADKPQP